ncbi:hypothetical protein Tco_0307253 [Tanacetum coccineum]
MPSPSSSSPSPSLHRHLHNHYLCLRSVISYQKLLFRFVFLTSSCEYDVVISDFRLELVLIGLTSATIGITCMKRLVTFSKLATVDLLGDTMVPTTQQEKSLIQDSIGPPSTRMKNLLDRVSQLFPMSRYPCETSHGHKIDYQSVSKQTTRNKSFPAFRVKSVGSTAPLEKCYERRKLDSMSSMFDARHELCFPEFVSDMNASSKSKSVKKAKKKEEWKPTGKDTIPLEVVAQESVVTKVYTRRPKYLDSGCSKHMTGDRSQHTNFIHKFLGTVKFGNDQIAKIMGYGDYLIGNIIISRVYYVE